MNYSYMLAVPLEAETPTAVASLSGIFAPFTTVLNWTMTYKIHIGGFSFTFFQLWIAVAIIVICINFFRALLER